MMKWRETIRNKDKFDSQPLIIHSGKQPARMFWRNELLVDFKHGMNY